MMEEAQKVAASLPQLVEEKTLELINLEQKISNLQTEFNQKLSEGTFELDMAFKTRTTEQVQDYLNANNLVSISRTELDGLRKDYETLKNEMEATISKKVAIVKLEAEREANSKIKEFELTSKANEAKTQAELQSKDNQIKFLTEQVQSWKTALDAEREAGVKRAQASSIGTVNLSATK